MNRNYPQTCWNLTDLFPGPASQELLLALGELETLAGVVENSRGELSENISTEAFFQLIEKLERIRYISRKLEGYAYLYFTEDTPNPVAMTLMAKIKKIIAEIESRIVFFDLWWKGVAEDTANRLMAISGDFRHWLEIMRQLQPYALSEAEERVINHKNVNGREALDRLYNYISNHYSYKMLVDGVEKKMTRGEVMSHMRNPDPDLRAASYQEHYRPFSTDGELLGQIYQTIARDWRSEYVDLRGYPSPISVRNASNGIPDEVVNVLLSVAQKNTSVFQRYFRLKARRLEMEKLRRYDLLAPITKSNRTYSFEEASGIIIETFDQFDPQFGELAERVFCEKHIDSEIRPTKGYLPFCSNVAHRSTPYINVNFQGRVVDLSTAHHEVGHAIHSMLAEKVPALCALPSLPLAETASTFSEMLLINYLLAHETDEGVRVDLLFGQVEHNYVAIQRQAFTALFEIKAHEMIHEGATVEQLANTYLADLRTQFGDSMDVSDEFRWEWVAYPHIFDSPFYVYAYAFGELLVLALYQQYKREGLSFIPKYKEFLSAAGSKAPIPLLIRLGVDPTQETFWQGGYDLIAKLVEQLENAC